MMLCGLRSVLQPEQPPVTQSSLFSHAVPFVLEVLKVSHISCFLSWNGFRSGFTEETGFITFFFPHTPLSISASFLVVTVLNHWEAAPGCEFSCRVKEGCSSLVLCNAVKNNKIKSITTSDRVYPFLCWGSILHSLNLKKVSLPVWAEVGLHAVPGIDLEYCAFYFSSAEFVAATLIWTCVNLPLVLTQMSALNSRGEKRNPKQANIPILWSGFSGSFFLMAKCGLGDGNGATWFCLFEKITMICRSEKRLWLWPTSRSRAQSRGGRRELKPSDCSIMGLSSFRNVYWKRGSICWISRRALLSARREAAELDGSFLQKRDLLSTCTHLLRAAQISSCISRWEFSALMGTVAESVKCRCFHHSQSFLREIFHGFDVSAEVCGWEVDLKNPNQLNQEKLCPSHSTSLLWDGTKNFYYFVPKKNIKINNKELFLVFSIHVHLFRRGLSLWKVCFVLSLAFSLAVFVKWLSRSARYLLIVTFSFRAERQLPLLQWYQLSLLMSLFNRNSLFPLNCLLNLKGWLCCVVT